MRWKKSHHPPPRNALHGTGSAAAYEFRVLRREDNDAQVIARAQAEARAGSMHALSDSLVCDGVPFAGQTAQKTLASLQRRRLYCRVGRRAVGRSTFSAAAPWFHAHQTSLLQHRCNTQKHNSHCNHSIRVLHRCCNTATPHPMRCPHHMHPPCIIYHAPRTKLNTRHAPYPPTAVAAVVKQGSNHTNSKHHTNNAQ